METIQIKTPIYKFKVKEHNTIKQNVLEAIKNMGEFSYRTGGQSISNTDWHINESYRRLYYKHCIPILESYYSTLDLTLSNYWFQQYGPGDYHRTHTHSQVNYSSIYYLDLPKNTSTIFEGVSIDVEEGDYVIFPAFLKHSSPINNSNSIKTSIVINLNTPD